MTYTNFHGTEITGLSPYGASMQMFMLAKALDDKANRKQLTRLLAELDLPITRSGEAGDRRAYLAFVLAGFARNVAIAEMAQKAQVADGR